MKTGTLADFLMAMEPAVGDSAELFLTKDEAMDAEAAAGAKTTGAAGEEGFAADAKVTEGLRVIDIMEARRGKGRRMERLVSSGGVVKRAVDDDEVGTK